ncbi:MAG: C25 family cysteine peptidase [Bacteroidales bacterium]|nr:C25 family cysteine peptidase [Bacteroidales bacterium]
MKKKILNQISIFGLMMVIGLLSLNLQAQQITINETQKNEFKLTENTYSAMGIQSAVKTINSMQVQTKAGTFTELAIPGFGFSNVVGFPKVPVLKKLIEIPVGSSINVKITKAEYTDFDLTALGFNKKLIPAQSPVSKDDDPAVLPFEMNQEAYGRDAFLYDQLIKVESAGTMRAISMANFEVYPVQYNPVRNILRVYHTIEARISFQGGSAKASTDLKKKYFSPFFENNYQQLFNYKPLATDELITNAPATYVIVSDPMFEAALQPFIAWKTKKGFKVIEAYTNNPLVGTTNTSIKSYLSGLYTNPAPGTFPTSFVLLVGDVAQIPAFNGAAGSHVTDLKYAEYTGDNLPEVYIGRFSAINVAQLQPQIDKTIQYEKYTFPSGAFLGKAVMAAGEDASFITHSNGQINYGTTNYFNTQHGISSYTYLQPEPSGGNYSQNIKANISAGICYANYTAHCSPSGWANPSFQINDVANLTNQDMYPLMVGNCCQSNSFGIDCLGETLLRAVNKGAVGYIGGTNNTYWDEDYWWGCGFKSVTLNPLYDAAHLGAYDVTFHDHGEAATSWYVTQGQMVVGGNMAVQESNTSMKAYYWEIYCLMGDPSVMVYMGVPAPVTATYLNTLLVGMNTLTVTTEEYALVSLSMNGIQLATGMAGSNGIVNLTFTGLSNVGTADIVITKQNRKPHIGSITVAPASGPYLVYQNNSIGDAAYNNNGLMDYGEQPFLTVGIKNIGVNTSENTMVTLRTNNQDITLLDSTENYGSIPAGQVVAINDAFKVIVANNIPDNAVIPFTLYCVSGTQTWSTNFTITAHAASFAVTTVSVTDPNGNNNSKLDPGETVDMSVKCQNNGSAAGYNVIGALSTNDPYIIISTTNATYGTVNALGSNQKAFMVSAIPTTPAGHEATFSITWTGDYDLSFTSTFKLIIGRIPVLIVDLDGNANSGSHMKTALDQLGVNYEYTTIFPTTPNSYASLFVCLGVYPNKHILTATEGQSLKSYLLQGGRIYMEGGDTWYFDQISTPTVVHPLFNVNGLKDNGGTLSTINGVSSAFTAGMSFTYTGDNNYIDKIEPKNDGFTIFNNTSPAYIVAVANAPATVAYKTVGSAYEFGGLANAAIPSTKKDLMNEYLEFFEVSGTGLWANFVGVPTNVAITEKVYFTDLSSTAFNNRSWTFTGGVPAVSTSATPEIVYNTQGTFDVSITVSNPDSSVSVTRLGYITVTDYTGINTAAPVIELSIYPNPASDGNVSIRYRSERTMINNLKVYNLTGNLVFERKLNNSQGETKLNAGELPSGMYLIKLETKDGSVSRKLIIK